MKYDQDEILAISKDAEKIVLNFKDAIKDLNDQDASMFKRMNAYNYLNSFLQMHRFLKQQAYPVLCTFLHAYQDKMELHNMLDACIDEDSIHPIFEDENDISEILQKFIKKHF